MAYDGSDHIRCVTCLYGGQFSSLLSSSLHLRPGLTKGVAFGGSGFIRGVTHRVVCLGEDNLVVYIYMYLS